MFNFTIQPAFTERVNVDESKVYEILIIGGGPSGLNAALYASRKGRDVAILAKRVGGQLLNTSSVENYLGKDGSSGEELTEAFRSHVESLKVPILEDAEIRKLEKTDGIFHVLLGDGRRFKGKTVILNLGTTNRKLNIPGEDTFASKGIAYCAICDAPLYKGKDVLLAGGGNSAVEAAIDVAKVAKTVTVIHRSEFRADKILVDKLYEMKNITVHLQTQILEAVGDQRLTGVRVLDKRTMEERIIHGDGLFIEIGNDPNTSLVKDLVDLNASGEVIVDNKARTSLEGLYAAGDMAETPYKQIIIAAASGAIAALAANEYLNTI
ncbi:MAG: thioredoxin reductase [Firmicutes bacterium GWF2_51_9]|nr:FAD-dependent oxidoreductase [Erysipelotrichaceae bacterium]OGS53997.1 MAG: thioredoxin reductase [Firmicutes bacterium GWF2_51_9]OGS57461.1 MAG: thioredoxin reductase [Firmicutes bacterium GWE2_51_13]HAM63945.1 thioredoxin reductase [Erysipelotrichaceae bacterium]HAO61750.1 thioredoxin reductase [Erysipelotrichaceae bacterium]